jgi:hypothetical protein
VVIEIARSPDGKLAPATDPKDMKVLAPASTYPNGQVRYTFVLAEDLGPSAAGSPFLVRPGDWFVITLRTESNNTYRRSFTVCSP